MVALDILQFPASTMDNFSYLLCCPETRQAAVVDPSERPQLLLDKIAELDLDLRYLINTHGHRDHVCGNAEILAQPGVQLIAHKDAVDGVDIELEEGSRFKIGNCEVSVWHTPGHSADSLVLRNADSLITGDTLFVSRCGRADLPGSDVDQLYDSLQRFKQLPDHLIVYPGHDYGPIPTSTLKWEFANNDFLMAADRDSFIRLRMG